MKLNHFSATLTLTFLSALIASTPTLAIPTSSQTAELQARDTPVPVHALPVHVIHEFPHGTWVENLAVRSNGQILATIATAPELYQVDPTSTNPPILVHTFPNATGLWGIVETTPDIFYVLAGQGSPFAPADPGTFSVWLVNLHTSGFHFFPHHDVVPSVISKVADIPHGILCNGMAVLSYDPDVLLIADSLAGVVWKLDVDSGHVTTAIQNPDMNAFKNAAGSVGINGLKLHGGKLYWTDTDLEILISIPIYSNGSAAGREIPVTDGVGADDFVFDHKGNTFIAQDPFDTLLLLKADGSKLILTNSTGPNSIMGPTAVQFGRRVADSANLYVTSNGGYTNYETQVFTVGGRVSRVDVGAAGLC